MPLRSFRMPQDLPAMVDLLPRCFVYPENEAWNLQTDEMESLADAFRGLRRIWPLIRVLQPFAPFLRDLMLGYIWEEDGQPVGLSNVVRDGNSDQWTIGNVAVLPEYRRRGIARKLVEACVALARDRNATVVDLEVVRGNLPAARLYEDLGFVRYTGHAYLRSETPPTLAIPPLPESLTLSEHALADWRTRLALAARITPAEVRRFAPVDEKRYRVPGVIRVFFPVLRVAMGMDQRGLQVVDGSGKVVAIANAQLRLREGGMNTLNMMVDPDYSDVTPCLLARSLELIHSASPGRRIEMTVADWLPHVREAAEAAGFAHQYDGDSMALRLAD